MTDRTAPKCQLRLEWVYGYRGHQVRSNLFYNLAGEIVYFVAGVGIVFNLKEHKQRYFLGHDDDIISLNIHPNKILVASGQVGKVPQIIVWDSSTLQTKSILKGVHTDGVGIVVFDQKGDKLASCGIDQDSTIAIWDWKKGKCLSRTQMHQEKVFDLQFDLFKENSLVSCGVKHISFWTLIGNTLKKKKGIFGQIKDMQTMVCVSASKVTEKYYAGTLSGSIYVWKQDAQLEEIIPNVHDGPIYTICSFVDGFLTGGKDGDVKFWDSQFATLNEMTIRLRERINTNEDCIIRSICWSSDRILVGTQSSEIYEILMSDQERPKCITQGHAEGELWSLSVSPTDPCIFATGSDDKTVRIWDMKKNRMLKMKKLSQRIRSCSFSADSKRLACGLNNGTLVVLNIDDMSEVVCAKLRNEVLHEMKYSPCGKYLAVGSNDNFVDVLETKSYKKVGTCSGSSSFITHLDWTQDSQYIRTNSGAGECDNLVFRVPNCKQVTGEELAKIPNWATFTGVLGNEVIGIWEKYSNKTDINATDAYFDAQCIVTGDDFGLVKLFRFPSLKKGAKFRKYCGHSSHVTNVRFNLDHTRVVTIGGADHAIFQWRFIAEDLVESLQDTARTPEVASDGAQQVKLSLPDEYDAYLDSNSEESDSDQSGIEIDSDIEREKEENYQRQVYKDDLIALKPKIKEEIKKAETDLREKRKSRPTESISIKHVIGYRGYDCRDNLFFLKGHDEIVYHIAALGIVYNRNTNTQRFYTGHTDDILCLCLHDLKDAKKRKLSVATGQIGRDPEIHVWDPISMSTESILKGGHYRGVCAVSFSYDGKKLASVGLDDDHCICVWDWKKGEKLATTRGHKDKIFCIKWNPYDPDKLLTVGVKHIKFWTQAGGGFTSHRGIFGSLSKVENILCATFGKDGHTCYTGVGNGMIYVWQDEKLSKKIEAHKGPLNAIYALEGQSLFVTGGKDGQVLLWSEDFSYIVKKYTLADIGLVENSPAVKAICLGSQKIYVGTRNSEIIEIDTNGNLSVLMQGHAEGELWGLACHPLKKEFCTTSDDKTVRIWSLEGFKMKLTKTLNDLGRSCEYSPDGGLIAIGMKNGSVTIFNENLEEIKTFRNRSQEISDMKFSSSMNGNFKYLAVGSHDNYVDIYHLNNRKRIGICKGSSSYISHVDWDTEGHILMVNTGARELLFFEAPRGNRVTINSNEIFNGSVNWQTMTGILGKPLEGIWPPCTDITDINSTHLSQNGQILATGDDFGLVKLFKYPCYGKFSKFRRYTGHSSHVTRVRWTNGDKNLISIGGNDMSIIIWENQQEPFDENKLDIAEEAAAATSSSNVKQISHKGESSDSDTDSEDEGYDSDVKREQGVDYTKSIFQHVLPRPKTDVIQSLYNAKASEKKGPSREIGRLKTTRVKKVDKEETKTDPFLMLRFMSTILASDKLETENRQHVRDRDTINGLKLNYIHGYRGADCRDNLQYIDDGTRIVYCAASAGIVLDLATKTQEYYLEHSDDIISLAVNLNSKDFKNVIATGQVGTKPDIHVWDAKSKETLSILSGLHVNGILSLNFSSSGRFLVSVGLDDHYTIGVWRWKEGTLMASHQGDSLGYRIFRASFRPDSDTHFVSVGFKHIKFWQVVGSQLISKKGVLTDQGQKTKKLPTMLSIGFGLDNITYTGSGTGDIFVWKENILTRIIHNAHKGPIFTIFTTLRDGCLVTGGKERALKESSEVKLWDKDMNSAKSFCLSSKEINVVKSVCRHKNRILVGTKAGEIYEINDKPKSAAYDVQKLITGHSNGSIWGLCVHPNSEVFATVSYDGYLILWNIRTKCVLNSLKIGEPIHSCDFNSDGRFLVLGLKDGETIVIECSDNFESFKITDKKRQRNACINDVKFSPDDSMIAVGCSDSSVDLYEFNAKSGKINRSGYCAQVPGSVLQMDWSNDSKYIRVGTSEYKNTTYTAPQGSQVKDKKVNETIVWNEWSSIFGEDVLGIWPLGDSKDIVNCAHLAQHANILATGDDYGSIKLFKFPCIEKNCEPIVQPYLGHSSNITNLKFTNDNAYLISTGGEDNCVFVWETIEK